MREGEQQANECPNCASGPVEQLATFGSTTGDFYAMSEVTIGGWRLGRARPAGST